MSESSDSPRLLRAKAMLGMMMLGAVLTGAFGYHESSIQWGGTLLGCFIGGLLVS